MLLGGLSQVAAQSHETRVLKAEMDSLAHRLSEIQTAQQFMSRRADSVAQAISRLKTRTPSPLEARSLDEAYRASQIVADSLQVLQSKTQAADRQLRQKAEALLKNLNTEIASLAGAKAEAKKKRQSGLDQRLSVELQSCRQWQKICQEILGEPPPPVLIYEVRVTPEDDARTLQRKADFLRDQADRLERELRALDQKLADMRNEAKLRHQMQEFAQEVAMFDPINEGLSAGATGGTTNLAATSGPLDFHSSESANAGAAALVVLNWPGNVNDLSDQDLGDWQKRLQQWHARRQAQADSLRLRAAEIEKASRALQD